LTRDPLSDPDNSKADHRLAGVGGNKPLEEDMNYRFDIDEWLPRFPLRPKHDRFSGEIITGPCDICNNEQLRKAAHDQFDWGPAVPVDVFVMAEGEPPNRYASKIGGTPYRPAKTPWPMRKDGKPMSFLAQINFADSRDLTGDLPGDLLLVFTPDADGYAETLHFEWQPLGLTELIPADAIPEQAWRPEPVYGHVCRTVSYPKAKRKPEIGANKYPMCQGKEIWYDYHLLQYQATQIGTAPFFIQPGNDDLPGRILCAINSVLPNQHKPYPWVNHPEPLMPEDQWDHTADYFMLGDVGCFYISIAKSGKLHFSVSCY
jgi:hypothetical protein